MVKEFQLLSCLLLMLLAVDHSKALHFDTHRLEGVLKEAAVETKLKEVLNVRRFSIQDDVNAEMIDNVKSCSCRNDTSCGCCVHMEVDKIHLNNTVCLNVSYLPKEIGVDVALVLDGRVLFDEKVSARNPPPICADVPYLKKMASLCLRLYNLDIGTDHFSGCAEVEARLAGFLVEKVNLGCFKLPMVYYQHRQTLTP